MPVRSAVAVATASAGISALLLTSPAGAAGFGMVGYNVNTVSSPSGNVTGVCQFVADLPDRSFSNMTILVQYTVTADQPAYAVNGICQIRDMYGTVYGSVAAGAPGTTATNAGTLFVPRTIRGAKACNTPEALWLDGTEANPKNLTECTPL